MKPLLVRTRAELSRLRPFRGITEDVKGRLPWYSSDWHDGFTCGIRYVLLLWIILPYIFSR